MEKENLKRNTLKTGTLPLKISGPMLENQVFPIVIKERKQLEKNPHSRKLGTMHSAGASKTNQTTGSNWII